MNRNGITVSSFRRIIPMVYAYTAPGVSYLSGMTKVGYTERQTVEERVREQTHTAPPTGHTWNAT